MNEINDTTPIVQYAVSATYLDFFQQVYQSEKQLNDHFAALLTIQDDNGFNVRRYLINQLKAQNAKHKKLSTTQINQLVEAMLNFKYHSDLLLNKLKEFNDFASNARQNSKDQERFIVQESKLTQFLNFQKLLEQDVLPQYLAAAHHLRTVNLNLSKSNGSHLSYVNEKMQQQSKVILDNQEYKIGLTSTLNLVSTAFDNYTRHYERHLQSFNGHITKFVQSEEQPFITNNLINSYYTGQRVTAFAKAQDNANMAYATTLHYMPDTTAKAEAILNHFRENKLLVRAHSSTIELDYLNISRSKNPLFNNILKVNVENLMFELKAIHQHVDMNGNPNRPGNRGVSLSMMNCEVNMDWFDDMVFLHNIDTAPIRMYLKDDGQTKLAKEAFTSPITAKDQPKFNKQLESVRKKFNKESKPVVSWQDYQEHYKQYHAQKIAEISAKGKSKAGQQKVYNEVVANLLPESLEGIAIRDLSSKGKIKALILQRKVQEKYGISLPIMLYQTTTDAEGKTLPVLTHYQPDFREIAALANDLPTILVETFDVKPFAIDKDEKAIIEERRKQLADELGITESASKSKNSKHKKAIKSDNPRAIQFYQDILSQMGYATKRNMHKWHINENRLAKLPLTPINYRHALEQLASPFQFNRQEGWEFKKLEAKETLSAAQKQLFETTKKIPQQRTRPETFSQENAPIPDIKRSAKQISNHSLPDLSLYQQETDQIIKRNQIEEEARTAIKNSENSGELIQISETFIRKTMEFYTSERDFNQRLQDGILNQEAELRRALLAAHIQQDDIELLIDTWHKMKNGSDEFLKQLEPSFNLCNEVLDLHRNEDGSINKSISVDRNTFSILMSAFGNKINDNPLSHQGYIDPIKKSYFDILKQMAFINSYLKSKYSAKMPQAKSALTAVDHHLNAYDKAKIAQAARQGITRKPSAISFSSLLADTGYQRLARIASTLPEDRLKIVSKNIENAPENAQHKEFIHHHNTLAWVTKNSTGSLVTGFDRKLPEFEALVAELLKCQKSLYNPMLGVKQKHQITEHCRQLEQSLRQSYFNNSFHPKILARPGLQRRNAQQDLKSYAQELLNNPTSISPSIKRKAIAAPQEEPSCKRASLVKDEMDIEPISKPLLFNQSLLKSVTKCSKNLTNNCDLPQHQPLKRETSCSRMPFSEKLALFERLSKQQTHISMRK